MTKEMWKKIPEITNYSVSSTGRIRNDYTGKILKTWVNSSGYECIKITDRVNGDFRSTIHRLVAKAFCEGYDEGKVVNHIDSNRLHNEAVNLEWMTYTESIHEVQGRGKLNTTSAREALAKKVFKKVDMYTPDGNTYIATFNSLKEAAEKSGARREHISRVVNGTRFTAGGYHWKFNSPC